MYKLTEKLTTGIGIISLQLVKVNKKENKSTDPNANCTRKN